MTEFPRLDRLAAMQQNPIGTFSSLRRPSPVATQYKRQSEMYGQALRNLSRAARQGDSRAAIAALDIRDDANQKGFTPGGIQRQENVQANIADREQSLMQRTADLGRVNTLDRRNGGSLGRDPNAPRPSFAEIDAAAKERSTLNKAFGTGDAVMSTLDRKRKTADSRATSKVDMPQGFGFEEDTKPKPEDRGSMTERILGYLGNVLNPKRTLPRLSSSMVE